jgi:hypothetical protein
MASSQFSYVFTESARTNRRQLALGKDPHHMCRPFEFLVQSLQRVGALHVLVMGQRQPVVGQPFLDVVLDPAA